jgi:hypothetical protein
MSSADYGRKAMLTQASSINKGNDACNAAAMYNSAAARSQPMRDRQPFPA